MPSNFLSQKNRRVSPSFVFQKKKSNRTQIKANSATEDGSFVDNIGVLVVMLFVFALILAFISYAKVKRTGCLSL